MTVMNLRKNIRISAAIITAGLGLQSCTSETPFSSDGEGTISFRTEMYSDVAFETRALDEQSKAALEEDLTIYIENSRGVIQRYKGKSSLPESLTLPVGSYAIEGWTGDSLSADFEKKFYRGYKQFNVEAGQNNTVAFNVNIANVIVSVDLSKVETELKDLKVKFNHTRGSLEFDNNIIAAGKKGYFMMPTGDNHLKYKVTVTGDDGNLIEKEGIINNVERAHEYSLQLAVEETENTNGGGLIQIQIKDIPVLDHQMDIYPKPSIKATYGVGQSIINLDEEQIDCSENCYDLGLRIVGYGGLSNLSLTFKDGFGNEYDSVNGVNLKNNGSEKDGAKNTLTTHGITIEEVENDIEDYKQTVKENVVRFNFSGSQFFANLPQIETPYIIEVNATDGRSYNSQATISIARTENAITKNLVGSIEAPDTYGSSDPFAILTTTAMLEGMVYSDEAKDYGIEYRIKDSGDAFTKVYPSLTRASGERFTVKLTGLKPGTTYEYHAFADGYTESKNRSFTTEGIFEIPNSNMDLWSNDTKSKKDNALVPSGDGSVTFWDSGNHGSAIINKNITNPDDDFIPGNRVARLKSESILSVLAAGNLFIGEFGQRNGTSGASLTFGRPFNGSHPSALKVKVNYRPGAKPTIKSGNSSKVPAGFADGNDHGQIYVAIASSTFAINTSNNIMFDKDAQNILGYGEITWDQNVGADGQLENIVIPIKYNDRARINEATHLIVVCSASKYGDFFCGSGNSVMYVDDFELEYGDIQWDN